MPTPSSSSPHARITCPDGTLLPIPNWPKGILVGDFDLIDDRNLYSRETLIRIFQSRTLKIRPSVAPIDAFIGTAPPYPMINNIGTPLTTQREGDVIFCPGGSVQYRNGVFTRVSNGHHNTLKMYVGKQANLWRAHFTKVTFVTCEAPRVHNGRRVTPIQQNAFQLLDAGNIYGTNAADGTPHLFAIGEVILTTDGLCLTFTGIHTTPTTQDDSEAYINIATAAECARDLDEVLTQSLIAKLIEIDPELKAFCDAMDTVARGTHTPADLGALKEMIPKLQLRLQQGQF